MPDSTPTDALPASQGQDWAYRIAFHAWTALFLIVVCVGLLNYLGTFAKRYVTL